MSIEALRKEIETLFHTLEKTPQTASFPLRAEVPLASLSPLEFLQANPLFEKSYWKDRDSDFEMAGLGIADCVTSITRCDYSELTHDILQRLGSSNQKNRYYGGIRFPSPSVPSPEWEKYGYYRFILPLFEVRKSQGHLTLSCTLFLKPFYSPQQHLAFILAQVEKLSLTPIENKIPLQFNNSPLHHEPSFALWEDSMEHMNIHLRNHHPQKVVMARKSQVTLSDKVDPGSFLRNLPNEKTFKFWFQVAPEDSFIGSSPECLFHKKGRHIVSEAVAGTRSVFPSETQRQDAKKDLQNSLKDTLEHGFVVSMLQTTLDSLCEKVTKKPIEIIELAHVMHLYQTFSGTLHSRVSLATLLTALHPTPAVSGYPVKDAIAMIAEEEPFDRGWYTGVVGYISEEETLFAVAIRCAHLQENQLSLYSGAGIVEASQALMEWGELNSKIKIFTDLLSLA